MRSMMILGGLLAAAALILLFGLINPRIEEFQAQYAMYGPLSALTGSDAGAELEALIQAGLIARMIAIGAAILGGMLFLTGLAKMNQPAATASTGKEA